MRKRKICILMTVYFVLPFGAASVLLFSDPGLCSDPVLCISMIAGISGFTWLVFQLLLSARLKFLERGVGLDRLLGFHRIMAPVSLVLLVAHAGVKNLYYPVSAQKISGTVVYAGFILAGIAAIFLFGPDRRRGVAGFVRGVFYRKMKKQYQDVKVLHNSTFLLTVLLFLHVFMSSVSVYYPGMRIYFSVLFAAGTLAYINHKLFRPLKTAPIYRVESVDRPTPYITSLSFVPERGKVINHLPGQFAFFRFMEGEPGTEEHPFTISDSSHPEITVKDLGDFTKKLQLVPEGARVRIDGPYGVFSCALVPDEIQLVFIAGGIGITPFLSMARFLRAAEDPRQPLLLWSVHRKDDLIYLEELERSLRVIPVLSNQTEPWDGIRGHLDTGLLRRLVSDQLLREAFFFICGPVALMASVRLSLREMGVPEKRIIREQFNL